MKTTFSSFVHAQGGRGELLERGGEAAGHGQGRHHRSGSLHRTGHVQLLGMLHVIRETNTTELFVLIYRYRICFHQQRQSGVSYFCYLKKFEVTSINFVQH